MFTKGNRRNGTSSHHYRFKTEILAPQSRVWDALSKETNLWWLKEFRVLGPDSRLELGNRAGAHLLELHGDDRSVLWFTIQHYDPRCFIRLAGQSSPKQGEHTISSLEVRLQERGKNTLIEVSISLMGNCSDSSFKTLEATWRKLITDGLKRYVENYMPSTS